MMDEDISKEFSKKDRALIITPAGCGKTEIIAKAISYSDGARGRQLILTHTHAGVKSLRDRLRKLGISNKLYYIDTIAGFALHYAASFPVSSGLGIEFDPISNEWEKVYTAATILVTSTTGERIIGNTFSGMYVDEYQDCTIEQHNLILSLANILPCRIVGDPLQGIFDFGNNRIVNWYDDVFPVFERLGDAKTQWIPYRWKEKNEPLGQWLFGVRNNLKQGLPVDISSGPAGVEWHKNTITNQISVCRAKLNNKTDTVVAIQRLPFQAHSLAKNLKGAYVSMEEVESRDLMKWAGKIGNSKGKERAIFIIEFAAICMTLVSAALATVKKKIKNGEEESKPDLNYKHILDDLVEVSRSDNLSRVLSAFEKIEKIDGRVLYRKELWADMKRAIKECITSEKDVSLQKAAWNMKDKDRLWGRRIERHVVSRTLLIKGLEFDHSVVLNADELNAKELYVAMTRGSTSLSVLSSSPNLQKDVPADLIPRK
jgi:hypothetical protein